VCSETDGINCTLYQLYIIATVHYINCTLYQLYIISTVHYINCALYQLYIISTVHYINCTLYQLYIISTVHYISSALYQLYIISTVHYINCTLYQLYIISTIHYINCALYQLHIISTVHYINCTLFAFLAMQERKHQILHQVFTRFALLLELKDSNADWTPFSSHYPCQYTPNNTLQAACIYKSLEDTFICLALYSSCSFVFIVSLLCSDILLQS
jgi:hypothetical protein